MRAHYREDMPWLCFWFRHKPGETVTIKHTEGPHEFWVHTEYAVCERCTLPISREIRCNYMAKRNIFAKNEFRTSWKFDKNWPVEGGAK